MASKSIRQLREDVTTRVLTLSGWKESRVAPDNFGRDADSIAHKAFAVLPSETADMRAYRGRPAEGLLVETALVVHYCWRLAPKGMSDSYDDALDGEAAVIAVLMAYDTTWPLSYKFQVVRTSRTTSDSGEWVLGQVEFRVVHTLPLQ
tara:strand:+ start:2114 stop:2557 length:444 start_codon:yes stop_codon:yes gene_type:complete